MISSIGNRIPNKKNIDNILNHNTNCNKTRDIDIQINAEWTQGININKEISN